MGMWEEGGELGTETEKEQQFWWRLSLLEKPRTRPRGLKGGDREIRVLE